MRKKKVEFLYLFTGLQFLSFQEPLYWNSLIREFAVEGC